MIEVLLRNYKPQKPFTIGWSEGRFRTANLPAIPARSGGRTNPASAKPAEEYVDAAVDLVKQPMTMSEFSDALTTKLGLTQLKARSVQDAILRKGKLKQTSRRYGRGAPIYIGMPEAIDELEPRLREQSLPKMDGVDGEDLKSG